MYKWPSQYKLSISKVSIDLLSPQNLGNGPDQIAAPSLGSACTTLPVSPELRGAKSSTMITTPPGTVSNDTLPLLLLLKLRKILLNPALLAAINDWTSAAAGDLGCVLSSHLNQRML